MNVDERLRIIERMTSEYERAADNRGETINTANYKNIRIALENLRDDLDGQE